MTNQENCGISVELPLRAYIKLTFGKSTMCFVEGKTSCVCADMFVDWNSCLCWTLWIQNSRWVLLHFVWTVISLLKGNFLIIENLPYIAGIAANKWVEFSISSLSLLLVWWTTQHSATAFTVLIDFIFLQYQQCWTIKHLSPFLRFSPDEILQKILITTI